MDLAQEHAHNKVNEPEDAVVPSGSFVVPEVSLDGAELDESPIEPGDSISVCESENDGYVTEDGEDAVKELVMYDTMNKVYAFAVNHEYQFNYEPDMTTEEINAEAKQNKEFEENEIREFTDLNKYRNYQNPAMQVMSNPVVPASSKLTSASKRYVRDVRFNGGPVTVTDIKIREYHMSKGFVITLSNGFVINMPFHNTLDGIFLPHSYEIDGISAWKPYSFNVEEDYDFVDMHNIDREQMKTTPVHGIRYFVLVDTGIVYLCCQLINREGLPIIYNYGGPDSFKYGSPTWIVQNTTVDTVELNPIAYINVYDADFNLCVAYSRNLTNIPHSMLYMFNLNGVYGTNID